MARSGRVARVGNRPAAEAPAPARPVPVNNAERMAAQLRQYTEATSPATPGRGA